MAVDAARAKSLFLAASDLSDAEQRAAYLDRECGECNGDLRARVEALLRANDAAPLPPARGGDETGTGAPGRPPETADRCGKTERVGAILGGKYQIVEEIGEGGMGCVYRAQQTEPVRRRVAVKVIKAGMDSKAVLARFDAERQALAMMDHPNIAKVLDGGLHNNRPYFVMELVKGVPITEYCDAHKLTPRQRLELFVPVCWAIQHAHMKGVIHRDIKPSNVLIALYDDKPVPKVIDFGVAKAAGTSLTDHSLITGHGAVVGTPEYMSPEQASFNNLDIDTRSDVYSLGVLLYELLTGSTPVDRKSLGKAALLEILRIVREVEAPKPSAKLSTIDTPPSVAASRGMEPAKLSKLMRGELDWVVLKALEKDRNRRYDTANGLARDIQRYLADEIVEARPASNGYRLRKFVRRHKGQVVSAGLVSVALLAGILGTSIGLLRAESARKDAVAAQLGEAGERKKAVASAKAEVEQRQKAEQAETDTLADYRASTDEAIEQLIGSKPELGLIEKTYLENTLKRYQAFANRQGDEERSRAIRSEGTFRVGYLWQKLGQHELARTNYQSALAIRENLAVDFPAVPVYRRNLAVSHNNLGSLFATLGKGPEADEHYRKGLAIQEQLAADFPAVPEYRQYLATSHNNLGMLLAGRGKGPEAEDQYRQALVTQEQLAADFPAVPAYRQELARSRNNLGNLLTDLVKRSEAEDQYRQALATQEQLAADFPAVPAYRQELARSHNNLGVLFKDQGKGPEAGGQSRHAVAIQEKLAADFPAVPAYRVELGNSYCNYGNLFRDSGNPAGSLEWFGKAIDCLQAVHEQDPRQVTAATCLRNSHWGRAKSHTRLRKFAAALKDWDRAIALSPPAERPSCRAGRATSLLQAGMVVEAVAEVAELTKAPNATAGQLYDFACVYSVASGKVANKPVYADRAMELLQNAVKAGYKDAAHLKQDSDLDPLRLRPDFKHLLAELEKGPQKK